MVDEKLNLIENRDLLYYDNKSEKFKKLTFDKDFDLKPFIFIVTERSLKNENK